MSDVDGTYYPELDAEYRRAISAILGRRPGGPPAVEIGARIAVNALHRTSASELPEGDAS